MLSATDRGFRTADSGGDSGPVEAAGERQTDQRQWLEGMGARAIALPAPGFAPPGRVSDDPPTRVLLLPSRGGPLSGHLCPGLLSPSGGDDWARLSVAKVGRGTTGAGGIPDLRVGCGGLLSGPVPSG